MRRLAKFPGDFEPGVRDLARALGRLTEPQGRLARQNARRAAIEALKALRGTLDTAYPPKPRERAPSKRRRPVTGMDRVAKLEREGWQKVSYTSMMSALAAAGIKVHRVRIKAGPNPQYVTLAPEWAIKIAKHAPARLATARRYPRERRALLTEIAMKETA